MREDVLLYALMEWISNTQLIEEGQVEEFLNYMQDCHELSHDEVISAFDENNVPLC